MLWEPSIVQNQIIVNKFYSFFETHREKGFHFSGETHNFWECVCVLDGSICVSADERVYTLERGELIFHKPMELHKYFVDSNSGAHLLIFSFSLESNLANVLKNKVFLLSDEQQQIIENLLIYVRRKLGDNPTTNASLPEHTYLLLFSKIPCYSQMVATYIQQLFLSLIGDSSVAEVSTAPDALTFSKAVNYMNNCITEQPSVAEIAAFCNISQATLKRIFDKYAGMGIHKYFLKLKINLATEMLQNGLSVTETAEKLGFSSQAYFSTVYKRETGTNPST